MYKISYTGDNVNSEFDFAFPFFKEADVHVAVNGEILSDRQYYVRANENFDGGKVIFPSAPEMGLQIDIFRRIDMGRNIDYQPTAKIDPENLNADFNFLLEAFRDLRAIDLDLVEWQNTHDNIKQLIDTTTRMIEDKNNASALGLYNNLFSILEAARPELITDYGYVDEPVPNENRDDYGTL